MEKLYIPERLPLQNEFITGIGGRELRQLLIAAAPGLVLLLIIAFVEVSAGTQLLVFLGVMLYWAACYALIRRDENNASVAAYIGRWYRFHKSQKKYYYKQEKEVLYLVEEEPAAGERT